MNTELFSFGSMDTFNCSTSDPDPAPPFSFGSLIVNYKDESTTSSGNPYYYFLNQ
jgi:hypothetical protein